MTLKCIGSGSSGNSYALIDNDNKIFLLDLGLSKKEILKGIDFRISDVVGAVVTHCHKDHSKSVDDFAKSRISVYKPYKIEKNVYINRNGFIVKSFDLTDIKRRWKHSNADGTECPCYGFLIEHSELGRMLYITDTEFVKWRFSNINHILISCNYIKENLSDVNNPKFRHVVNGHMELETVKQFIKANNSSSLQNVILCHISKDNSDIDKMVAEVKKVAPQANVCVASKGLEIELKKGEFK